MELKLIRDTYTEHTTVGTLVEAVKPLMVLCYTLEDARRAPGIKVDGATCLPPGRYKMAVTYSQRFKRYMIILYNCANGYEVKAEGISFTGIRMHGGNTHHDTRACICVAHNRIDDETIQGTAEAGVTALVKDAIDAGEEAWLEIE